MAHIPLIRKGMTSVIMLRIYQRRTDPQKVETLTVSTRARWGAARVAVAARWAEIKAHIDARWPLIDVYRRIFGPEPEITYSGFRKQVRLQEEAEAQSTQKEPVTAPAPSQGTSDAGSPSRTFDYNPVVTPEDEDRLAGR